VKRRDRRVQRTHRTLHGALLELILERGWDGVSVQDICERADVGRSTFYVHFADKEELLLSGLDHLREVLRAHLASEKREPLGFTLALVEHVREFEPLFKALLGKRTAHVAHRAFMELLNEILHDDLAAVAPKGPLRDATVRYVAGALWELLRWWLEQRSPPSAVEIDAIFKRLTVPVLQELRSGEKR
jgi:AcrR family transcriptional regulator